MKPFTGHADDKCPKWARELIEQLLHLETQLGNIPPGGDWTEEMLDNLHKRTTENDQANEETCQRLFFQICHGLTKEGFAAQDIASFVNVRIGYIGGPPYCSKDEVTEAAE